MTRHGSEKFIEALILLNRLTRYLVRNSLNIWLSSLERNQIVIQDNSKIVANAKVFISRLAIYLIDMASNKNISIPLHSVSLLRSTDFLFVVSHNEKCNNYLKWFFMFDFVIFVNILKSVRLVWVSRININLWGPKHLSKLFFSTNFASF